MHYQNFTPRRGKASVSVLTCILVAIWVPSGVALRSASAQPAKVPAVTQSRLPTNAWALPDPDQLVERALTRIVTQDMPNAIPVLDYRQRLFGNVETLEALRKYAGRPVLLRPSAFTAVSRFEETRRGDYNPCTGSGCDSTASSIWLAITRVEHGELPHELHLWYTTSFASTGPAGYSHETYSFCERWLRVGGMWRYDGFVSVKPG